MTRRLAELLLLLGAMVLAVLLYRSTAAWPEMVQGSTANYVRFLALGLGLLCLYELSVFIRSRRQARPESETGDPEKLTLAESPLRFWGLLALLGLYAAAFDRLGFYLSSALFLPLAMLLLGARKPLTIILTTAGVLLFVYLVFARLLEVPLPAGTLFG